MEERGPHHDGSPHEHVTEFPTSMTESERRSLRPALERKPGAFSSVNAIAEERLTTGERLADTVTNAMGSWRFITIQSAILIAWVVLNVVGWIRQWDPYPFILLNLALSFQAAYAAPIIMMSQNRQAAKDRLNAEHDFQIDMRAELEVEAIQRRLDDLAGRQWDTLVELQHQQLELLGRIGALTREVHRITTEARSGAPAGEKGAPGGG